MEVQNNISDSYHKIYLNHNYNHLISISTKLGELCERQLGVTVFIFMSIQHNFFDELNQPMFKV